jgi:hypothetical protein
MIRRLAILTLTVLVFLPASMASDATASQQDDIREAVFRYQFDHNQSGLQGNAHAYCLAATIGEKEVDPSDQFIKRFAHHKPPVRKASACHWAKVRVVENRWGKPALIFFVSKINWTSDEEATVNGGYREGNMSSSVCSYAVKKENGKWTVAVRGACAVS